MWECEPATIESNIDSVKIHNIQLLPFLITLGVEDHGTLGALRVVSRAWILISS